MWSTPFVLSLLLATTGHAIQSPILEQSDGCGKTLPKKVTAGGASANISITSGGLIRSYLIHVPQSYDIDTPVPLILSYHGRGKNASEQELLSQFSNSSYNPNAIAVYPQGVANSKGTRQWYGDPDAPTSINDISFTSDLISHLLSRYCLDPTRLYAAGKSNGGGLVGLLACDPVTSGQIAAFAPVSGAFYLNKSTGELPPCNPSRLPIPIIEFHGWKDKTIRYLGGPDDSDRGNTTSIPVWVDGWAARDNFSVIQNVSSSVCPAPYKKVTKYNWNNTVEHYNISNLFHDWPSTYPNDDGNFTTCFDATSVIMDFFSRWTL
ncbi:carbohydrate esterase family 1 protein [Glonium stellatum]|uniref:feruloyl esterase n=1 Tax=Glonium stellatum TaxID=574774 RepID=A0A8E2EML7_9PEZI|nr:carbohydrate esterase family 1 protein [Glonium stellatum]